MSLSIEPIAAFDRLIRGGLEAGPAGSENIHPCPLGYQPHLNPPNTAVESATHA